MQDSARRRQHAAADDLNRSAITEGARHRCEEQEREKAAMRSATLQEVSNTYCRGLSLVSVLSCSSVRAIPKAVAGSKITANGLSAVPIVAGSLSLNIRA